MSSTLKLEVWSSSWSPYNYFWASASFILSHNFIFNILASCLLYTGKFLIVMVKALIWSSSGTSSLSLKLLSWDSFAVKRMKISMLRRSIIISAVVKVWFVISNCRSSDKPISICLYWQVAFTIKVFSVEPSTCSSLAACLQKHEKFSTKDLIYLWFI